MRWGSRPLMCLLCLLLSGTIAGSYLSGHFHEILLTTILLFVFVCILFRRRGGLLLRILLALFFIFSGMSLSSYEQGRPLADGELMRLLSSRRGPQIFEGWVISGPDIGVERTQLVVELSCYLEDGECRGLRGRAGMNVLGMAGGVSFGDIVRFKATLKEPADYLNPGAVSFADHYRSRGIAAIGTISEPKWIAKRAEVSGHHLRKYIEGIRRRLAATIYSAAPPEEAGIMAALVTGMRNGIPFDVKESFRLTGVIHVLVISGLHVGFVAMIFWWMSKWLLVRVEWLAVRGYALKAAALTVVAAVWIYAMLAGLGIPAVRAAIMASVFFAGVVIDRKGDIYQSLAIALFIIVLDNPLSLFDPSLQLTFASVAGLAALAGPISAFVRVPAWPRCIRWAGDSLAVSTAATVGVGPLIAYYFCQVSLLGFAANLPVVPAVGFVLVPLGMAGAAASIISGRLGHIIFGWMGSLCGFLIGAVRYMAGAGSGFVPNLAPGIFQVVSFYVLAACIVWRKDIPFKKLSISLACLLFMGGVIVPRMDPGGGSLEVVFLDVGQGASVFVRFPTGSTMLIDGGGIPGSRFDIGRNVIAPYLWRRGVHRIDRVVLTHPHPDHFKGLSFIAMNFAPEHFYHNGAKPDDADAGDLADLMRVVNSSAAVVEVISDRSEVFEEGGVRVTLISPFAAGDGTCDDLNDTSIVIRIEHQGRSFLITGDIEAAAERRLIEAGFDLTADVMQVPHHGSRTSTSAGFLKEVGPSYAVIQAGLYNRYGFPNSEVVERLQKSGAKLLRTDLDGAVAFKSKGGSLVVEKTVDDGT